MNRLLSRENLLKLIQLVESSDTEEYAEVLEYLKKAYANKWGEGSLYAVNWSGAIVMQQHFRTFDG